MMVAYEMQVTWSGPRHRVSAGAWNSLVKAIWQAAHVCVQPLTNCPCKQLLHGPRTLRALQLLQRTETHAHVSANMHTLAVDGLPLWCCGCAYPPLRLCSGRLLRWACCQPPQAPRGFLEARSSRLPDTSWISMPATTGLTCPGLRAACRVAGHGASLPAICACTTGVLDFGAGSHAIGLFLE